MAAEVNTALYIVPVCTPPLQEIKRRLEVLIRKMGYLHHIVVFATCLISSPNVHCQVTRDNGECGSTKGCFMIPEDCNPDAAGSCEAFSSWSLQEDNSLLINLQCQTSTYIALGFSKSGGMANSDVYACTSENEVVRSANGNGRDNSPLGLIGVSEQNVVMENGIINCSFIRQLSVEGEDSFFDLSSPNMYTAILAWGGSVQNGVLGRHTDREASASEIDFTENSAVVSGSNPLAKIHGCFMVLAWLGFASIGITTARFFKKSLPGEICGKPSWFAIHRFCMASVVVLFVLATIFIFVHARRYIAPSEGSIKFTHAILGTLVVVLGLVNVIMALFRPHPGEPKRPIFNWAHWGVGTSAYLIGAITILLGTSNRESQGNDRLLDSVPEFVFWVVVGGVFFHLVIWLILTIIDLSKKKVEQSQDIQLPNKSGSDPTSGSTRALADPGAIEEPAIKRVVYGIYFIVVAVIVIVVVVGIGVGV